MFDDKTNTLALTCLALTVAAGGRIVVRDADLQELERWRLIVTEDKVTGDKTYEAKQAKET